MNNLIDIIIVIFLINISREPVLGETTELLYSFKNEEKYRALLCFTFSLFLFYFLFLGSQTTSEDVFPEDERLNLWFLGVKKVR